MRERNIIVALDVAGYDAALRLATQLDPAQCRIKVGKALFTRCGPRVVNALHELGHDVFLDLKYHDIPNTVAEAVAAAADLGVWMVNIHAQGGMAMLSAAHAVLAAETRRPLLIAVTVLTSMTPEQWQALGQQRSIAAQVDLLTALAAQAGLDGVVCSAHEAQQVKAQYGTDFVTVTPGIRPAWAALDDQARIMTPEQAVAHGSDYLVIGRPITRAEKPSAALARIHAALTAAQEINAR